MLLLGLWFGLDFVGVPGLVKREPLVSLAGLMLALMLAFVAAGWLRMRYAAPLCGLALAVWAVLQVQTHWITYALPASTAKLSWYERVFGSHWKLLPELTDRTTPDAYHTVLFALLVVNLLLATWDCWPRPAPQAG